MQLSWLDSAEGGAPCTLSDLESVGVFYRHFSTDPARFEPELSALCQRGGYTTRDEVSLSPAMPNLQTLLDKFKDEHLHDEDEVRFVLAGGGIFDLRSKDDRWMRVTVGPGDVLIVPRGLYHRFFLTETSTIRCVRLFQDPAGWKPHYRAAQSPAP